MSVFAVFFWVLSMGALFHVVKPRFKLGLYAALGICFLTQCYLLPSFKLLAFRPNQADLKGLTHFLAAETDPNAAVLTAFELGPAVAAYTGHPVILHSKFESKPLRDKIKRVYTALYQPEEQFYGLCRTLAAGLFVYQTNMVLDGAPGSLRYVVGAIPLRANSAAFSFHFAPERLQHFSLVYQNGTYRVFEIDSRKTHAVTALPYHPVYDLSVFLENNDLAAVIDDAQLQAGLTKLSRAETHLNLAQGFSRSADYDPAILEFERALDLDPANGQAVSGLVLAINNAGRYDRLTIDLLQKAVAMDPQFDPTVLNLPDVDLWIALAQDALSRKEYPRAEALFEKARSLAPASEVANLGLGSALWAQGKTSAAEAIFWSVVSANPNHYQAYESLGKIYAARGQIEKALEYTQASLRINPAQPHLEQIVAALRARLQQQRLTNQDFDTYMSQADRMLAERDWKAAQSLYLEAAKFKKPYDLLVHLATASHEMGQDDTAMQYLREAIAMQPGNPSAKLLLKNILIRQNLAVRIGRQEDTARNPEER
jgi:tetratricopeptide (TPR) repeat protein